MNAVKGYPASPKTKLVCIIIPFLFDSLPLIIRDDAIKKKNQKLKKGSAEKCKHFGYNLRNRRKINPRLFAILNKK